MDRSLYALESASKLFYRTSGISRGALRRLIPFKSIMRILTTASLMTTMLTAANAAQMITSYDLRKAQLVREAGLVIVDVRPADMYAREHIEGAGNVRPDQAAGAGLDRTGRVVIYCGRPNCPSAESAAKGLEAAGYKKVEILDGGLGDWIKAGYPTAAGGPVHKRVKRGRLRMGKERDEVRGGKVFVVDVRPAPAFEAGHLPGAHSAPLEELANHFIDFPRNEEILVYDRLSERSQKAYDALTAAGFKAEELSGGIAGWIKGKHRLEVK